VEQNSERNNTILLKTISSLGCCKGYKIKIVEDN